MSMFCLLSRCALYQVVGESAERVLGFLSDRISDKSRILIDALQRSSEKAWKSVEVALAGESLWNKLDAADEKAFRQQIRTLIDSMQLPVLTGRKEFGRLCLKDLQMARKDGLLLPKTTPDELAQSLGSFARQSDQAAVIAHQKSTVQEMSVILEKANYKNLGWLVGHEVQPGQGLLVVATQYFFRRAVETNEVLSRSLQFTRMESLTQNQEAGFKHLDELMQSHAQKLDGLLDNLLAVALDTNTRVQDVQAELTELKKMMAQMMELAQLQQRREVRHGDSCSLRGNRDKQKVQDLVDRYEALPEAERRKQPEMLETVAMLQVASGETQAAQQNFDRLAHLATDPKSRAQALFNAHSVALEHRDFSAALDALREAVQLDHDAYSPFPFADYHPQKILGAGGFGVAFLCQDVTLDAPLVVKTIRLDGLDRDVNDVLHEARTLIKLDHPAIIRLRGCRFADPARKRPYLVMDYFQSEPLSDYVKQQGPLAPQELLPVAHSVAEALHAAHAQGIFHRDIKPDNLLVRREANGSWKVKLIDFGLAVKQESETATVRTPDTPSHTPREFGIAGTIDYAAPEQMGRLPGVKVGSYSDVYGFGKTCYFALLGTPEPDDSEKDSLDERWRKLLSQCTARKIDGRIKDFAAVLERLRGLESHPVVSAAPPVARAFNPPKSKPVVKPAPSVEPTPELPPLPSLEIDPVPPPPRKSAATPPTTTSVPPRYITPPTGGKESKPAVGGLWGAGSPPPPGAGSEEEDIVDAVPLDEGASQPPSKQSGHHKKHIGSLFETGQETPAAEPADISPPEETPPPPAGKKPKKGGPMGGAFGG